MTTTPRIEPFDPSCGRPPRAIPEYIMAAAENDTTPELYVAREEGTYNPDNGHFLCTECYIKAGMSSSRTGWVCP